MDFQELLDKIKIAYTLQRPFVAYRKPNEKLIKALFQNDRALYFLKDYEAKGFVFAPFDSTKKSILIPLEKSEYHRVDLDSQELPLPSGFAHSEFYSEADKQKHLVLVNNGIDFINAKQVEKVVLSRKQEVQVGNFNLEEIFKKLLSNYNNATCYVWFHPKVGLWLGATPETLITVAGKQFKTMSLAATRPYVDSLEIEWNAKELEEQQIVTDFITSNLSAITDHLKITEPTTVKAGNIIHLKSSISGNLKSINDLKKVLDLLHPTPAVCGMPKAIAKQFILENEQYDREFYSGYLGELNLDNTTALYVNLRCVQLKSSNAYIYIGGGIIKGSTAESEWQETIEKAKVMLKVLVN